MAESVQKVKVEPVEFVEDRKLGKLGTVNTDFAEKAAKSTDFEGKKAAISQNKSQVAHKLPSIFSKII